MRIRDIAIGAVLAALLAGGVAITMPQPEPLAGLVPARAMVTPSAPVSVPAAPGAAKALPAADSPRTDWRDMHAKFVHTQSLREFFYEAMRKPEGGAIYYAMQALFACERVLEQDLAALGAPRRAAADELQRRCDFTPEGLRDAKRELHASRNLDLEADPLLDTVFNYLSADGSEGRAAMLSAAFDQGNPEIIASLVATAVVERMPPPAPGDTDSTAKGVPYGAALVACRLGADCGPNSIRTLELCMQNGWCAGSVPAALEQGLGRHFPQLDKVATRVVNDVRRGDTRRLVPQA